MQPSETYGQAASSTARRSNSSSSTESLWHLINIKNIRKTRKRHNPLILLLMPRMKEFTFDPRCSKFDPRCNKFDPWLKLFSRKIIKTKRKNYNANQVRRFLSFWSVNVSRPNREIFYSTCMTVYITVCDFFMGRETYERSGTLDFQER